MPDEPATPPSSRVEPWIWGDPYEQLRSYLRRHRACVMPADLTDRDESAIEYLLSLEPAPATSGTGGEA